MSLQGTVCVKFTPKQYMKLYECGLLYYDSNKLNTDVNVLGSLVKIALPDWTQVHGFRKITSTLKGKEVHNC